MHHVLSVCKTEESQLVQHVKVLLPSVTVLICTTGKHVITTYTDQEEVNHEDLPAVASSIDVQKSDNAKSHSITVK